MRALCSMILSVMIGIRDRNIIQVVDVCMLFVG